MLRQLIWRAAAFASLTTFVIVTPAFGQRRGHDGGTTRPPAGGTTRPPAGRATGGSAAVRPVSPPATSPRHAGHHVGTFPVAAGDLGSRHPAHAHHRGYARRHVFAPFLSGYYYRGYPYYYGGYPYYYGGYPYDIGPAYAMDAYSTGFPSVGGAMGYQEEFVPAPPDPVAVIHVQLPADAELWVEGAKMKLAGPRRRFVSPPLEPGVSYTYEIRAVWLENGRKVDETQNLVVRVGNESSVTFVALPADANAAEASANRR